MNTNMNGNRKKEPHIYRVKTLMDYSDIDMLVAKKNVASRIEYFELLDQFIELEPEMVKAMEESAEQGNHEALVRSVGNLQDHLMEIGATLMTWEAEKVASLAHQKAPYRQCVDEAFLLSSRLDTLRTKLMSAIMEDPEEVKRSFERHAKEKALQEAKEDAHDKLRGLAKPEPIEELIALIENYESDDAMLILENMRKYSYTEEIDALLVNAQNQLGVFEFEQAINTLREIIGEIKYVENGGEAARRKVILAVDDMPDVLNAVKSILSRQYMVYGVTNPKAALKFLTGKHADLILLDIEMPDMDGFAMMGIIRRMKSCRTTPVIFLSGNVNLDNVRKSFSLGANEFIRKPVVADTLLPKVEKYLETAESVAD